MLLLALPDHQNTASRKASQTELARPGRTHLKWKGVLLAYWTTGHSNDGDIEAINGLIEHHRHMVVRGYRDSYRLRILLTSPADLTLNAHTQKQRAAYRWNRANGKRYTRPTS